MDLLETLLEIGKDLLETLAPQWLEELFGDSWREHEARVKEVTDPIFAEAIRALQYEGLLNYVLGGILPPEGVARKIWEIRRPFDRRATEALAALGISPKGNPS